ncbi:hypothetical protein [Altererythrobacter sp. C41]|uniref:hypothetical protein n=1 Tax=Altererythrobacter sp. C41 TaxID=2806021 RepID=UPI001931F1F8|nr:hypothetical protein [Altererythrobacter sp. C41]MBM0169686.1 hypothetical protein [Altererythrobacter sp. C41]
MDDFHARRALALAILNSGTTLTRKAGSFLGQCAVDPSSLTERQREWFKQLAEKAGLTVEA